MFKSKLFWYAVLMPGSIIGWLFIVFGLVYPIGNELALLVWKFFLILLTVTHPLELFISIPIGNKAGLSTTRTVINTLLFGFTWWLPLKLGVIEK